MVTGVTTFRNVEPHTTALTGAPKKRRRISQDEQNDVSVNPDRAASAMVKRMLTPSVTPFTDWYDQTESNVHSVRSVHMSMHHEHSTRVTMRFPDIMLQVGVGHARLLGRRSWQ